jgi:lipopolysaccharide export system protein LptA
MTRPLLLLTFCAALVPMTAMAAATTASPITGKHDNNAPINIDSDRFVADNNAKTGTFMGNVQVTQGDIKMRADQVRMSEGKDNKPDKVVASGKVVVDSPASGTATADNALYDVNAHTVLLTGHVVLTKQKKAVMTGPQLTVNMTTGVATMPAQPGGRVHAIFTPAGN